MLLRDAHLPLGGRLGPVPGGQAVLDYAPLEQELRFLQTAALADWGFHAPLSFGQPQADKLLQNILTSDLGALRLGQAQPSLLLDAKGKVLGLLRLARHQPDHLDVLVEAPSIPTTMPVLSRYATVGKAPLEDRSSELGLLLVLGPRAPAAIEEGLEAKVPKPGEVVETPAGNVLLHAGLASPDGFLLVVRLEQAREAWDRLVAATRAQDGGPVGWAAVEAARVRAAVPRAGTEVTQETLPGEAGLDGAVSYTKGCFVGQEVVARIKNLGHVNKHVVLLAPDAPVQAGEAVQSGGKDIGRVTSIAPGPGSPAALALVRREFAKPGEALTIGTTATAAKVTCLAQLP